MKYIACPSDEGMVLMDAHINPNKEQEMITDERNVEYALLQKQKQNKTNGRIRCQLKLARLKSELQRLLEIFGHQQTPHLPMPGFVQVNANMGQQANSNLQAVDIVFTENTLDAALEKVEDIIKILFPSVQPVDD